MTRTHDAERPVLEVNTNAEWVRLYSCADFDDIDETDEADAVSTFMRALDDALADAGFETENAKGQRTLCHGWHGANTFRHKIGPVGTFGDLTDDQIDRIESAYFDAADVMAAKWAKRGGE